MSLLTEYVVFHDGALARRHGKKPMPIDTLFEAYFEGALDIPGNIYALLADRHAVTQHKFTPAHVKYFLTRFVPEFAIHSKKMDEKLVRWHYDRGDDFFAAFLGPRMVYTSAFFTHPSQSLEQGQDQKMDMVCQKLMLKPGDRLLDIGCGWGTLAMHAARHYGATSTGVTLSKNQTAFGNARIEAAGMGSRARIFAGADASLPLAPMMNALEKAKFEIHSVENVTTHYRFTIEKWHDNWLSSRESIVATYGERWFRIWHVFLAWATTIAAQGTAACFQVLAHKNLNHFDRTIWIGKPSLSRGMDLPIRHDYAARNGSPVSPDA